MPEKKLFKSRTDKIFAGVVGGLGEYFDVDATLLRLTWMLIVIFTGIFLGVIAYIFAALIIPKKPAHSEHSEADTDAANEEYKKIVK